MTGWMTPPQFQFHNGSIKSEKMFSWYFAGFQVSIPQWFD